MPRDPYEYFRVEAREILDGLGRGILQLEKGATPEITAGVLRLAHTLKGAARVVKQSAIAESAHAIEEDLSGLREARGPLDRGCIEHLFALVDAIAVGLRALDPPALPADGGAPETTPRPRAAPEESIRFVRADAAKLDTVVDAISEAGQQLRGCVMRWRTWRRPDASRTCWPIGSPARRAAASGRPNGWGRWPPRSAT